MTTHQLFNAIDSTNDKYLKEVLDEQGAATKRHFPIKPLAVCAACLAVIIAGTAILPKIGGRLIDPLDRLSHSGLVKTTTDPQSTHFSGANVNISFGQFSTVESTSQPKLSVKYKTIVSTDVFVSLSIYSFNIYKGYFGESVPARLQLLADGEPIAFSIYGESSLYHDVDVAVVEDETSYSIVDFQSEFPIMFTADPSLKQLTAVVTFYPETVFDFRAYRDSPNFTKAVSARNIAAENDLPWGDENYKEYLYIADSIGLKCADFDKYIETADSDYGIYDLNSNYIIKEYGGNEFITYREGEDLILDINATFNYMYRLYVMIDGHFIPWADGEYSKQIYNLKRKESFTIPGELIPEGDQHSIQVLVEPILSNDIDICGTPSLPTKTLIKGEPDLSVEFRSNDHDSKAFITVKTEKMKYKKGEPIKLTATVKNISTAPITLSCSYPSIALSVNLFKDGEELINREGFFGDSDLAPTGLILEPDEEYVLEMTFDQTVLTPSGTRKTAERGVYKGVCTVQTDSKYGTSVRAYMIPIKIELI